MKIGILGTRGIPNHYGGFEQWAELLSQGLVKVGVEVWVYNSHNHPYKETSWNGVNIIHQYDPEYKIGTSGQFIYDLNSILDSRKRNFDIILQLGFTSSSIWGWLLPRKNTVIITNMDGIEWKRAKFNAITQNFLKFAEKLAVCYSDHLIADNPVINDYYLKYYKKQVSFIPYGTTIFENEDKSRLIQYDVEPFKYKLLIARLEPENNIETVIKGIIGSDTNEPLLIVGNLNVPHGKYLLNKYSSEKQIRFLGGIYNTETLNNLRFYSGLYFHGHSVGGTNPSLLEAMACNATICAHDNPYNRSVMANHGYYFETKEDIVRILDASSNSKDTKNTKQKQRVNDEFLVEDIIEQYYNLFLSLQKKK